MVLRGRRGRDGLRHDLQSPTAPRESEKRRPPGPPRVVCSTVRKGDEVDLFTIDQSLMFPEIELIWGSIVPDRSCLGIETSMPTRGLRSHLQPACSDMGRSIIWNEQEKPQLSQQACRHFARLFCVQVGRSEGHDLRGNPRISHHFTDETTEPLHATPEQLLWW